jgi:hypothetical protein
MCVCAVCVLFFVFAGISHARIVIDVITFDVALFVGLLCSIR